MFTGGSSETNQDVCFPNFFSNLNSIFIGAVVPSGQCAFTLTPIGDIDYTSHEFRAVFDPGSSIRLELGGFLSDGEDRDLFTFASPPPVSDDPATQVPIRSLVTNAGGDFIETDVRAIFGAAEWSSADDSLRVGIEARYTENEITGSSLGDPTQPVLTETFSFFTPRFSVDYRLNDDALIYGSIARGAKPGGFNPSAIQDPARPELADNLTFEEELNWTYELGLKSQFLNNRLTLNAAVFYTDWSDLQLNAPDPGGDGINVTNITLNLGDARVYGLELDGILEITDNFSIDGSFSIVDNRYKDGTIDSRFATPASGFFAATIGGAFGTPAPASPCDDVVCSSDGDVGGNRIERTPPMQATFGAEYNGFSSNGDLEWFIRGDLSWQDEFFATPANTATIPSRFLVSASAGVTYKDFDLTLWARNLTDETYVSNSFAVIIPFGNAYNTFYGDRRSLGATLKVNF
ncbi:MAG: TonB-dependent receptor [Pseudomonadota bacterium]